MLDDVSTQIRGLGLPASMLPEIGNDSGSISVSASPKPPAGKPTKALVPPKKKPISKKVKNAAASVVAPTPSPKPSTTAKSASTKTGSTSTAQPAIAKVEEPVRRFIWRGPIYFKPPVPGKLVKEDGQATYLEYQLRSAQDPSKGVPLRVYGDLHGLERLNRRDPSTVDGIFSLFEWSDDADSFLYATLYLGPCDPECTLIWHPSRAAALESFDWGWIHTLPGGGAFVFMPIEGKKPGVIIRVKC